MPSKVSRPSRVGGAFGGVFGAGDEVAFGGNALEPGGAAAADTGPAAVVGTNGAFGVATSGELKGANGLMTSLRVDSAGEGSRLAALPKFGSGSIAAGGALAPGLA